MELMLCLVDYTSDNPDFDIVLHKAGDIIEILPDGSDWGKEPPKNPDWLLVKVPNMTRTEAESYNAPELPDSLNATARRLRRRQFAIGLAGLRTIRQNANNTTMTLAAFRLRAALKARLA